jgi:hypothetical protein
MAKPNGTNPSKGKKNRKWGRNKVNCERYRKENRREKNKARRAARREKDRENWLNNYVNRD